MYKENFTMLPEFRIFPSRNLGVSEYAAGSIGSSSSSTGGLYPVNNHNKDGYNGTSFWSKRTVKLTHLSSLVCCMELLLASPSLSVPPACDHPSSPSPGSHPSQLLSWLYER